MTAREYITTILKDKDVLSKEEHTVCRSLMTAMTKEELTDMAESNTLDWYLQTQAEKILLESVSTKPIKEHNQRWSDYLLSMKSRKNVQASREKLRQGFDYYEWKAQKTILQYFLSNGLKTDRIWAFQKILDDFSIVADTSTKERKTWQDLILSLWQQYRDIKAAWVIVKHFQYDVIEANAELLSADCGYQPVALRLGVNPDYDIDVTRLTDIEQLYVIAKLHRPISDEYAESLFYLNMLSALSSRSEFMPRNASSIMSLNTVRIAVWCLGQLCKTDTIIRFYKCNCAFKASIEQLWTGEYDNGKFWDWVRNKLSEFFPYINHIQQSILEDMMSRNPALRELVESLNLKLA